jgi:hypothetical protein
LHNFDELKRKILWDKRLNEIMREIGIFLIFLITLYIISFTNVSFSAFSYNELFEKSFVEKQSDDESGLNDVNTFSNSSTIFLNF